MRHAGEPGASQPRGLPRAKYSGRQRSFTTRSSCHVLRFLRRARHHSFVVDFGFLSSSSSSSFSVSSIYNSFGFSAVFAPTSSLYLYSSSSLSASSSSPLPFVGVVGCGIVVIFGFVVVFVFFVHFACSVCVVVCVFFVVFLFFVFFYFFVCFPILSVIILSDCPSSSATK